uniref:TonB family protein n=1 Tax=Desulfobacca acetoxidans TaxID=60893 RepID=A0A7V4G8N1_9BACT
MQETTAGQEWGFSGNLALSLAFHLLLGGMVLWWAGTPRPPAPVVLTVSLVAPAPEPGAAPPGPRVLQHPGPTKPAPARPRAVLNPAAAAPLKPLVKKPPRQPLPSPPALEKAEPFPTPPARPLQPPQVIPAAPARPGAPGGAAASAPARAPAASGAGTGSAADSSRASGAGPSSTVLGHSSGPGSGNADGKAYSDYMQLIRSRILAKRQYPPQALQRHQEGVVRLRFTLSAAGTLDQGVEVVKPSGVQVLDNQARACVQAAAPFPPIPPDLKRDRLVVEVPVIYRLSDAGR